MATRQVKTVAGPASAVALFKVFWSGFTTPSYRALAAIVAVFVACVVATVVVVTPFNLGGKLGTYLPRYTRDSEGFATHEALRLALRSPPVDPSLKVVVIGDSIVAHAFASDTALASDVAAATRRPASVAILATAGQGVVDEATLADYATRARPGVVVLGLFYGRYRESAATLLGFDKMGRLGMRSPWGDAAVRALGGTPRPLTGDYLLDNSSFVLRNLQRLALRWFVNAPTVRRIDIFTHPPETRRFWDMKLRGFEVQSLRATGDIGRQPSAAILGDTVRNLLARGNRVILVEQPVNESIFDHGDAPRYQAYLAQSAALAHRVGAEYCDLTVAKVPPAAFYDPVHIADKVQQARLRLRLAGCIAAGDHGPAR